MGNEVFANGMEIACKSGDGKVIAAFPDVCLSPPSPPAGPVPVPYPDSSFSKDMKNGSRTVKIDGKEMGLKNKSFFKTSPLGDEAATRSFGGNVVTHTITGKTYFIAWSMDVKVEGQNAPRHGDLTTSNHASYPGGTPPVYNTEAQELALIALEMDLCPCCHQDSTSCTAALSKSVTNPATGNTQPRTPWSFREWYRLDETDAAGNPTPVAQGRRAALATNACTGTGVTGNPCPNASKDPEDRKADPPCDVYRVLTQEESDANEAGVSARRMRELRERHKVPVSKDVLAQTTLRSSWATQDDLKAAGWSDESMKKAIQIDHRTPRAAGGCPTSENNTVAHGNLCNNCQRADELLDSWSSDELVGRRAALGV